MANNSAFVPRSDGGFLKRHAEQLGLMFRAMDLCAVLIGAHAGYYLRYGQFSLETRELVLVGLALLAVSVVFSKLHVYKPWRISDINSEVKLVAIAWLSVVTLGTLILYLTKTGDTFSRAWIGSWWIITFGLFILMRLALRTVLRRLRERGHNIRRVLVVGAGELGERVVARIRENDWTGLQVVGFLDDDESLTGKELGGVPVLGTLERVRELSGQAGEGVEVEAGDDGPVLSAIDQAWITLPLYAEKRIREVCDLFENTTVSVRFVPNIFTYDLLNCSIDELAGIPVINLSESTIAGNSGLVKRLEDIVVSSLAIALTSPVMLAIAAAIKLGDPGPVLFRQRRYGIDGREIIMWKFRTMRVMENDEEYLQATRNDGRVTPIGMFLRKTSLDELPQFFNVLQGRMSVVGPRPHPVAQNEQYRGLIRRYMWRHKVKPGITGLAQINGWRGETDTAEKMEKRIELDIEYINNWSVWLDLKIILQSLYKGFVNKNAY